MNKSKKITLIISIALVSIILLIGVTYALSYTQTSTNQELVLGDIYMRYNEISGLSITDAVPGSDYSNYFEFTISGKNTYTKKDIVYEIFLTLGDIPEDRYDFDRIPDEYLKFKLTYINENNQEIVLFKDIMFNDLSNQKVYVEKIEKNTQNTINKKYRLYMTIDNSLEIGNQDTADFTLEDWMYAFASVKVNVIGHFELTPSETILNDVPGDSYSCSTIEDDGIIYMSGKHNCMDSNYVWYSGKLWRVTAIYPDGRIKMITDNVISIINYGSNNVFYTDDENKSYIYQWLNEDFLDTLYNHENIVEKSKWNATSGNGTFSYKLPETKMVEAKVGLLNSYEYYIAGKNVPKQNNYLNIGYGMWLLNPSQTNSSKIWYINSSGNSVQTGSNTDGGVRPSIILKSTVEFKGGTGKIYDPYTIKGDKEKIVADSTLLNTRTSGEYVSLNNELFRIVGIENDTTKLNMLNYLKDTSNTIITKPIASTNLFGNETNIKSNDYFDYYLNNVWLKEFDDTYNETLDTSNILEKGTYYINNYTIGNYKEMICTTASNTITTKDCEKTTNTWTGYVGLLRYGEMFAAQYVRDVLALDYWFITPHYYESSNTGVYNDGHMLRESPDTLNAVRPTINLKSTVVIKSGSGTLQDPFIVGLPS